MSSPTKGVVRLGDLQLAIMQVLWRAGEATVAEVHEALAPQRSLAVTTVATMLKKMEARDLVRHRSEGRRFVYSTQVTADRVRRSMVGHLRDHLFGGDRAAFVAHLIDDGALSGDELAELKALIDDAQQRQTGDE